MEPSGTVCNKHRHRPATWICTECGTLFCDECLGREKKGGASSVLYNLTQCQKCNGICRTVSEYRSELKAGEVLKAIKKRALWMNILIFLSYSLPLIYHILFVGMESYPFFSFILFSLGLTMHTATRIDFDPQLIRFVAPVLVGNSVMFRVHMLYGPQMLTLDPMTANLLLTPLALVLLWLFVQLCYYILESFSAIQAISIARINHDNRALYSYLIAAGGIVTVAYYVPGLHRYYEGMVRFNRKMVFAVVDLITGIL